MSQTYNIFVPTLKHTRLSAIAQAAALHQEKENDRAKKQIANEELLAYFAKHRYWWVNDCQMIFDTKYGNLWQAEVSRKSYHLKEAIDYANNLNWGNLKWKLPTPMQIYEIVGLGIETADFPLTSNMPREIMTTQDTFRLVFMPWYIDNNYKPPGLTEYGNGYLPEFFSDMKSHILCLYNDPIFSSSIETLKFFDNKNWNIRPCSSDPTDFFDIFRQTNLSVDILDEILHAETEFGTGGSIQTCFALVGKYQELKNVLWSYQDEELKKFYNNLSLLVNPSKKNIDNISISDIWRDIDFITTRLDKLDKLRFNDVGQGIWEFYAPPALQPRMTQITSTEFIRPRNPVDDIREATVAIDFGTSSTVVAIRENGRDELLRIGMQAQDFTKNDISDEQYENPTVLEFLDIQKFLQDWHSEAYRPLVEWANIHCSHEARAKLRNNNSNSKVVSSILLRLKQWALRNQQDAQVRIRDQKDFEYQLHPLEEKNPVKGQPLQLTQDYPELDPIEIYAWFLGMTINWRARGIFLHYVLTFPVNYANEIKAKILASFRRGIQRSLPESLIYDERFNSFTVEELQSEPAAFAAAAFKRLKLKPTEEGIAYGVFDFGGGTTDFDYGIYRLPTEQEDEEGWDVVLEHFGSSGDNFLGGENLLENMAYLVFQQNSAECRKNNVSFTLPIDAERFAGSETLIAQTQAAYTNTTMMMSKLRPLWENGKIDSNATGVEQPKLINKDGEAVTCEISIKQDILISYLKGRILQGLLRFFNVLKEAFEQNLQKIPEEIHILLAGNASRSNIVLGFLGGLDSKDTKQTNEYKEHLVNELALIFDDVVPKFVIHEPFNADGKNPYSPTAKTGVALGLLEVAGGEGLKVVNHASQANNDSPFQFYIGGFRKDYLQTAIHRGQTYNEWIQLGKPRNGVFIMGYTKLPTSSLEGIQRGTTGVFEKKLNLSGNIDNQYVFAQVLAPNKIEICTASSLDDIKANSYNNAREIELN